MEKEGVKLPNPSQCSTGNRETCSCRPFENVDFYNARHYRPSPGALAVEDWRRNPFIWLHYVQSNDGSQLADFVLRADDTSNWSIHDVQRYFCGQLHCENVLFPCQYPNLRLPTLLGRHSWRTHAAHKRPPSTYLKELHRSLAIDLKKMEIEEAQMDRLIVYDQLIKIDLMDHYRRKMFFSSLLNILSFQDSLQLVSFENLRSTRLEGVRLVQQLACFNSHSLKYLFLWFFVREDENPLLVNYSYITGICPEIVDDLSLCPVITLASLPFKPEHSFGYTLLLSGRISGNPQSDSARVLPKARHGYKQYIIVKATLQTQLNMSTDEDKAKLLKMLQDLEVPESRLPERCQAVLRDLEQSFPQEDDVINDVDTSVARDNPYIPDKELIEENERKLRDLLSEEKRIKTEPIDEGLNTDPQRPWRTNSSKEKLFRIEADLKRHIGRATELIEPLAEADMRRLVTSCQEDARKSPSVGADRLRETVVEARRNLPNFQYRRVDNTTATAILPQAHGTHRNEEGCGDAASVQ